MEHLLTFSVIFLYLRQGLTNERMCGDTRNVFSTVGGEVVLPVQQTDVQDITWMTEKDKGVFAVTEPGRPVTIRSLSYNGRLNVTANGSLMIIKLTMEDQGIYKGSILRRGLGQCAQLYRLSLYGLTNEKVCRDTRHLSSKVGGEVVLPIQQTEFQDITWMNKDKSIFAVTEPEKPVTVRSLSYNGRLSVTANGSLIIVKLTKEDQGIYKGSILRRGLGQCAQLYNLTVYEEQIYVFSNATTTSPVRTTTEVKTTKSSKQVREWIVIIMCVTGTAALVLMFVITMLISGYQNIKKRRKTEASREEAAMLYTQLDIKCRHKGPPAREVQDQSTVTYSDVKIASKTQTNV
ncbi:pregnancy-specific glycoprotein 22-like [Dendropsophus ebraccatus]|uniref:pregnancy-specific glycoprotein 22-like n=1 Tax=Dendropsophus ebraccatus TaxID=150705 RepID=UPI0038311250